MTEEIIIDGLDVAGCARLQDDKISCDAERYRSTLEEINLILDELKQQYDYMTDYSEIKEIQDKINEVLNA